MPTISATTPTQDGSTAARCFCTRDEVCDACRAEDAVARVMRAMAAPVAPEPDPWAQYR